MSSGLAQAGARAASLASLSSDRTLCGAEPGKDYRVEELTWLWDVTTIADKRIIEENQKGVDSRFYESGPYTAMEDFARAFINWYLHVMK